MVQEMIHFVESLSAQAPTHAAKHRGSLGVFGHRKSERRLPMTVPSVHQESAVPLSGEPSLFVEEWVDRCAREIVPELARGEHPLAVYRRFRETHPALFLGVYLSPKMTQWRKSLEVPPLRYEGDQLWLDSWGIEPSHPVELVRVPRHRLVILVAVDSLLVLRESELVEALGGSSSALAGQQIGGVR
jgi:hypothetical protein